MRRGLLAGLVLGAVLLSTPAAAKVVDKPVAFAVQNVNRSLAGCAVDGGTITVRGHVTGRAADLRRGESATLLLHGFGYSEFFWRFDAVPGYNAGRKLARRGHVVVTVDRPGYGASRSEHETCLGSQADIAHQIVGALERGDYEGAPGRFERVALGGHSAGGAIAELAAASFDGIDGLAILSYVDNGATPLALTQAGAQTATCLGGGAPGDPGYAPLGATEADFRRGHLNAPTDPAVADAVAAMRTNDPCGDVESLAGTLVTNQASSISVAGPTLLLAGTDDALFPASTLQLQAQRLRVGGAVIQQSLVADTGHGLVFGGTAPTVIDELDDWMDENGF